MKITKRQLRRIIKEEKAKIVTEAPNIPDVMGAIGGGKFQPRHEVIEVVDGEWGDVLFFSDRPVKLSADGPMRKPASDIGDWNALVKDLKLQPEDITDTLIVQEPGHSMYELSHDEFAALELALEKEKNPSLKNVSYTPDPQREGKEMKITKNQLRRIIKEEKAKLLEMREMRFDLMYKPVYSTLEDMVMMNLPDDVEFLTEEEFAKLEGVVAEALRELKDRVVDTRRFDR